MSDALARPLAGVVKVVTCFVARCAILATVSTSREARAKSKPEKTREECHEKDACDGALVASRYATET
jgi:hypothetical protein